MATRWSADEHTRCVECVLDGRTYAQIARTLNVEFHGRRTVRTEKAIEVHCAEYQCQTTKLRRLAQRPPRTPAEAR